LLFRNEVLATILSNCARTAAELAVAEAEPLLGVGGSDCGAAAPSIPVQDVRNGPP
jgi:hypothetical protein